MGTPSIFCLKNLTNLKKPRDRDADDSSSISRLPDEIILEILNKSIDLKTLCSCYLVSRRFSSIVLQVDAISFTAPPLNPHVPDKNTDGDVHAGMPVFRCVSLLYGESFIAAYRFLSKFKGVKSLRIELPFSSCRATDNRCLFKWKVKFGTKFESFIFLSPSSIFDKDEFSLNDNGDEENGDWINDMREHNLDIAFQCMKDVRVWRILLLDLVKNLLMLEKISITDLGRRGRLSLSGKKLSELKKWVDFNWETVFSRVMVPYDVSFGRLPVLKLPVSGYVMKGVYFCVMEMEYLKTGNDDLMNSEDGFEDKEEVVYNEAMMEILKERGGVISMPIAYPYY